MGFSERKGQRGRTSALSAMRTPHLTLLASLLACWPAPPHARANEQPDLELGASPAGSLVLNEILAVNESGLRDEDGDGLLGIDELYKGSMEIE